MRHISQREAHRLQREVTRLREQEISRQSQWTHNYPGGAVIVTVPRATVGERATGALHAAQILGHPLVARFLADTLYIYALPPVVSQGPEDKHGNQK